ncbi:DUF6282 family protein [Thermodesulfobacteriota bacterium]
MHIHCYPEISLSVRRPCEDWETVELARDAGMRALVLKSHTWPTMSKAHHLSHEIAGIDVFGSITLNVSAGGLNPWAVEMAARQGAKVVWMPTWSSKNDWTQGGFSDLMKGWMPSLKESGLRQPLTVLDSSGELLPEVVSIISVAKEHELVLSTGHLSTEEALSIGREAEKIGFTKLIFGHPLTRSVGATLIQMKEMVNRGAHVELTALSCFWPGTPNTALQRTVEVIDQLGAEHCILTTDSFGDWPPPSPEFLRMFLGRILILGVDENSIRVMVKENPSKLLDLSLEGHNDYL